MKEITVRELVEALRDEEVEVYSIDGYGIGVNLLRAKTTYDEGLELLVFTCGSYLNGGVGSVSYCVGDRLKCVGIDEESGEYTLEFSQYMLNVMITKMRGISGAV